MEKKSLTWLLAGDLFVFVLVTMAGFATHNTLTTAGARFFTTLLPLLIAWAAVAPFMGVYDENRLGQPAQLWRPVWAMVVAAPLAGWLRGLWLGTPVIPVFVAVLGGSAALAIILWRGVYLFAVARKKVVHG